MNRNSFQKNPFINSNSKPGMNGVNKFSNYEQLGRKTVEEVKKDMIDVKYNHFQEKIDNNKNKIQNSQSIGKTNGVPDFKSRVDMLKKVNRG